MPSISSSFFREAVESLGNFPVTGPQFRQPFGIATPTTFRIEIFAFAGITHGPGTTIIIQPPPPLSTSAMHSSARARLS